MSLLVIVSAARADIVQHVRYAPPQLPSAQGWEYLGGQTPERDVFRVRDGVLIMDTIDVVGGTFFQHRHDLVTDPAVTHVTGSFRCRVIEGAPYADSRGVSLIVAYEVDGPPARTASFTLGTHSLRVGNSGTVVPLDATAWHDYALVLDLAALTADIFVDGAPVAAVPLGSLDVGSRVTFGDGVYGADAHAEFAYVDAWLSDAGAVAATPSTWSAVKDLFAD